MLFPQVWGFREPVRFPRIELARVGKGGTAKCLPNVRTGDEMNSIDYYRDCPQEEEGFMISTETPKKGDKHSLLFLKKFF